jgi:hypothetical protein
MVESIAGETYQNGLSVIKSTPGLIPGQPPRWSFPQGQGQPRRAACMLAGQGTQVTALHVGYMATDMVRHLDVPKIDPAVVAKLALDGLAAGAPAVLADDTSLQVQAGLAGGVVAALYPQFA